MAVLKKASPEEKQAKETEKREKRYAKAWEQFWASPAGKARQAFEAGDHVFQYSLDVANQDAIIVAMVGSSTTKREVDPTVVLNSVSKEGWELLTGDFVFVMTGQQSRDKFMSSGQNVAVAGSVIGYYLFKRCDANRDTETLDNLKQRLWDAVQG